MNQESPSRLEANNQILAAPVNRDDPLALELSSDLAGIERTREPRIRDLDALEPPPLEDGDESAPDALDLGQLGHRDTLAMALGTCQSMISSSTDRSGPGLSPR